MAFVIRSGRGVGRRSQVTKQRIRSCRDAHTVVDAINRNADTVTLKSDGREYGIQTTRAKSVDVEAED